MLNSLQTALLHEVYCQIVFEVGRMIPSSGTSGARKRQRQVRKLGRLPSEKGFGGDEDCGGGGVCVLGGRKHGMLWTLL